MGCALAGPRAACGGSPVAGAGENPALPDATSFYIFLNQNSIFNGMMNQPTFNNWGIWTLAHEIENQWGQTPLIYYLEMNDVRHHLFYFKKTNTTPLKPQPV